MKPSLKSEFGPTMLIIAIIVTLGCNQVIGQATTVNPTNTNTLPTDFLGWDPSVTTGLQIRHNTPDQPIIFATNGLERMRIKPNRTIAVNTTDNEDARFNIQQDITKGTAVRCVLSNFNGNIVNYGFRARMTNAKVNLYGIHTYTAGIFSEVDFALRGTAEGPSDNYGIYASTQGSGSQGNPQQGNWAGVFIGGVDITNGMYLGSDESLKQNIESISGAREKLLMMRPVSFYFTDNEFINLSEKRQYGFIAQEMQEIYPELVREVVIPINHFEESVPQTFNHLALNRIELIPILVQGMKEQKVIFDDNNVKIDQLNAELSDIQSFINALNNEE